VRRVDTSRSGRWRLSTTYVTDPRRNTVLVSMNFRSLTGRPYKVYVIYDPALSNDGNDDTGSGAKGTLIARDGTAASALAARPALGRLSSGYLGKSDGWTDLRRDKKMNWSYARAARRGNVVQTARTRLTGRDGHRTLRVAVGFGRRPRQARTAATGTLGEPFAAVASRNAAGWARYLTTLRPPPPAAARYRRLYYTSLAVLHASEDKRHPGADIASPSMPWAWAGTTLEKHGSGAYHLVWARDLYEIATAQIAAGDRAGAARALSFLFGRQQKKDGSFPQNSEVDGSEHATELQLDEVAFPIVLAWQLGRADRATYRRDIRPAARFILRKGPSSPQERWENQEGYSPATIAAEIAGLVCAGDIARRNGDAAAARRFEATADRWQRRVERWTATRTGPYSAFPYYLRLTKNARPDTGVRYKIGDSGPSTVDQRTVVDPSFLELVRLGVKAPDDPTILNSLAVVDGRLRVVTPGGTFWHRFSFDGYGERMDGGPWGLGKDDTYKTFGRAWPIFAGERGEYELAAGRTGAAELRSMANAANAGQMIPEQVWDDRAPSGTRRFPRGEGTFSATPLAWSHAQFVRLALSLAGGAPVETPSIVACRYVRRCGG
jgi:glucoamylase